MNPVISISNWSSSLTPAALSDVFDSFDALKKAFASVDAISLPSEITEAADLLATMSGSPELLLSISGALYLAGEELSRENVALLLALMWGESRLNPSATAKGKDTTATGLLQITNSTANLFAKNITRPDSFKPFLTAISPFVRVPSSTKLWKGATWRESVLANPMSQVPMNALYWKGFMSEFDSNFEWTGGLWRMKPRVRNQWFIKRALPIIHVTDYFEGKSALIAALHLEGSTWLNSPYDPGQYRFIERMSEDPAVARFYLKGGDTPISSSIKDILGSVKTFLSFVTSR